MTPRSAILRVNYRRVYRSILYIYTLLLISDNGIIVNTDQDGDDKILIPTVVPENGGFSVACNRQT